MLISVCTEAERLDEALDLVKRLARKHGTMQQHTLNSLTRSAGESEGRVGEEGMGGFGSEDACSCRRCFETEF